MSMPIFYVYRFKVKKSGLFYVGVTTNIDARKRQHWCGIHVAALLYRKRTPQLPAYGIITKHLENPTEISYQSVVDMVVFHVLDIKDTKAEALQLERLLIQKYSCNPKSLNIS